MIRLWDGLMSLVAALITIAITAGPLWAAHLAIDAGLVTPWIYAAMAGLLLVGLVMLKAFVQKAFRGVGPLRERKR